MNLLSIVSPIKVGILSIENPGPIREVPLPSTSSIRTILTSTAVSVDICSVTHKRRPGITPISSIFTSNISDDYSITR